MYNGKKIIEHLEAKAKLLLTNMFRNYSFSFFHKKLRRLESPFSPSINTRHFLFQFQVFTLPNNPSPHPTSPNGPEQISGFVFPVFRNIRKNHIPQFQSHMFATLYPIDKFKANNSGFVLCLRVGFANPISHEKCRKPENEQFFN